MQSTESLEAQEADSNRAEHLRGADVSAAFQPWTYSMLSRPVFLPGRNAHTQGFRRKCGFQGNKPDFDLTPMHRDGHVRTFILALAVMVKTKALQMAIP